MINTGIGFEMRTDLEDLEDIGWDFSDVYEGTSISMGLDMGEAEAFNKKHYHVFIVNRYGDGISVQLCHNQIGVVGDGINHDAEQTEKDIQVLYASAKCWQVEEGE